MSASDPAVGREARAASERPKRDDPGEERVNAQGQSEKQCETTNFRHVGEPRPIFSETSLRGNREGRLRIQWLLARTRTARGLAKQLGCRKFGYRQTRNYSLLCARCR